MQTNSTPFYEAALRWFQSGDLVAAEREALNALAASPDNGNYSNLLGAIRMRQEKFSDAAILFADACLQMPGDAGPRINHASALNKLGRFADAARAYLEASAIDAASVDRVAAESHYTQLGKRALRAIDIETAAEAFVAACLFNPGAVNSPALSISDANQSASLFAAMSRRAVDNAAIEEKLAFALHKAGRIAESKETFFHLTTRLAGQDGALAAIHSAYNDGLIATGSIPRFQRRQRFESLSQIFKRVADLPGALAECGCARGLSAFVICTLIKREVASFRGQGFHIFDSFEGLSEPTGKDRDGAIGSARTNMVKGQFAVALNDVQRHLSSFPLITYHPGWIPSRFSDVADLPFKFLNLDVDLYEPTRDSILFFYPRLVPGGLIVSDDYNWPGCRSAIDECAERLGFAVELTPHNQAIIVKT